MTVASLKKAAAAAAKTEAREQAQAATPHHTDFQVEYSGASKSVDLFKQTFRVTARAAGRTLDLSPLVAQLTWQDQSADLLSLTNIMPELTGSIQLYKPTLSQYKKLIGPLLAATVDAGTHSSRFGALGVQVICSVGYGKTFTPLWAMRSTTSTGGDAEAINLEDGTWTLNLADDLFQLGLSLDDFKFTKGKKIHRQGWHCHQIAAAVCKQYGVPIKQLARGTTWISLPPNSTQGVPPTDVISAAYKAETDRTGRVFVMRWAAPSKKFPGGALEVVPMRRNPNLLRFREQLTNAALTRNLNPDFATVITGTASVADKHGKHRNITYTYHSDAAVKRFGWVHKKIPFGAVSSRLELQILVKRALAWRLTPLRAAELTHPGVSTIRRGDAIRIDLPEEGYSATKLDVSSSVKPRGRKYSALALAAAQKADPSLFGTPDPSTLSATGAASLSTATATSNPPVTVLVADQGIAFVQSVTHTVSAGTYSMDMVTGFVDVLDPISVRQEVDAMLRDAKKATGPAGATGKSSGGKRWRVTASAEVMGGTGSCGHAIIADGYSELSTVPQGASSDFKALGNLACGTQLVITNPVNNKSVTVVKQDVGAGSAFLPVMGLYPGTQTALGLSGSEFHVTIQRADGGTLQPVRGTAL